MRHLTHTGPYAGTILCGISRDGQSELVHAVYAPLHLPDYRQAVCRECLTVYAENAYDASEQIPDYLAELRSDYKDPKQGGLF
jgi:hypothetical protein